VKYRPHGYQQYATRKIVTEPAVGLFLEMGLGKTVITLTAIDQLVNDMFEACHVLVIAPLRVAEDTWSREATKWDHLKHLRISKVLGSVAERQRALAAAADIYVINRENVEWLVAECGHAWPFDMVVIDELSSFKSPSAKRFKALRKVRPMMNRIVGLTGTPAPNGLLDLWSQVYLLDQGERLGKTVTGYRARYFEPDRRNAVQIWSWKPMPEAEAAIHAKLADLCVSMKAEDWLEMPERVDLVVPIVLDAKARAAYERMERDWLIRIADQVVDAATAAVVANKLLQLAGGVAYDDMGKAVRIHTAKLEALEEIIEAANGNPVLVYYAYRTQLPEISDWFFAHSLVTPRELKTAKDIEDWNAGRIPVMLAHPASAGHGLNLQGGGSVIVWYGPTWSLELYQQANARLHRQGQKHSVIVHHLVAEGTIDEQVMQVLAEKGAGQDRLIEAVKARLAKYQPEGRE
jgi:SNF2 family DNA or RNA helicase